MQATAMIAAKRRCPERLCQILLPRPPISVMAAVAETFIAEAQYGLARETSHAAQRDEAEQHADSKSHVVAARQMQSLVHRLPGR